MPRPKGSKNKKKSALVENVDEKLTSVQQEVERLTAELKSRKAELKKLMKAKAESDQAAAEKKAEEDKQRLIEAVSASGKTIEEVLALLK